MGFCETSVVKCFWGGISKIVKARLKKNNAKIIASRVWVFLDEHLVYIDLLSFLSLEWNITF